MENREQWGSRAGFILAAVGSAIGLGNIWRFPYIAYENGGGAFFVPYIFALLTAGIPFMIMEFGLGHKYKGSAPKVLAAVNAKFEWLGWVQIITAAIIAVYYAAVIGWTINYLGFAFDGAWGADTKGFFFGEYLGLTSSPTELGGVRWPIFGACALTWGLTWLACNSGIRNGIERACKILIPLLFALVLVFIGRVITLPGATDGLDFLFTPDFSKLTDFSVWAAAYGQIFYSLSIGFGIMVAYSSYLPKKADISNNAAITVFINCGFSTLAGIMIFSVLGSMAHSTGKAVADVAGSGVGLAFITIPAAINTMPAPLFFGTIFFLCLTMAGVSSHISIVEAVSSSVIDKFGVSRQKVVTTFCIVGFALTSVLTTGAGLLILDIVDHFSNTICILFSALVEIILMSWVIGLDDIREDVNAHSDFSVGKLWAFSLRIITVLVLGYSFLSGLYTKITVPYGGYPTFDLVMLGWSILPLAILVAIFLQKKQAHKHFQHYS
ncbi:sodium-dependent transporter [Halodesulfovibrio aestuarii]|uniref:Transporter n=1 Tax=Halodesulfovibrio aestuarii TaxID=126333 RepID=A0A8G2C7L7_9BACT|nr:sodium-dependent transporter [Halodesulfovibrio aestuarii]SHI66523.1 neurotransmitter:Na+ symporter, NSS family [Halodesulfovibrio aestuarii]